jgi:ubiquinone/menaquinone biosynthesis C-methylase UbiE
MGICRNMRPKPKLLKIQVKKKALIAGSTTKKALGLILILILEFSQPAAWFVPFHWIQVRLLAPFIATLITQDLAAYRYLGASIAGFPDALGLERELREVGFTKVTHQKLLFGTVALHQAIA